MSENLINLVKTIRDRKNKDKDKSYTSSLLSGGLSKCIDKMEEEFGEFKEALNNNSNIVHEAADTIYHLLVTLEVANIKF
jgi:phosphoribosyl-ATP pyrophosphohydrolase